MSQVEINKEQFISAYRRYMEKGGHSYDEYDMDCAWKDYCLGTYEYNFLFEEGEINV